jgi:hypothetical protein
MSSTWPTSATRARTPAAATDDPSAIRGASRPPGFGLFRHRTNADCSDLAIVPTSSPIALRHTRFGLGTSEQPVGLADSLRPRGPRFQAQSRWSPSAFRPGESHSIPLRGRASDSQGGGAIRVPRGRTTTTNLDRAGAAPTPVTSDCSDLPATDPLPHRPTRAQVGTILRSEQSAIPTMSDMKSRPASVTFSGAHGPRSASISDPMTAAGECAFAGR